MCLVYADYNDDDDDDDDNVDGDDDKLGILDTT